MSSENVQNTTQADSKNIGWFKSCRIELDKVVKPTFDETKQATIVTLVILMFVAVVLCCYDFILGRLMGLFVS